MFSSFALEELPILTSTILKILAVIVLSYLAYYILKIVIKRSTLLIQKDIRLTDEQIKQRAYTLSHIFTSITKIALIIISVAIILRVLDIDPTPVIAGAGIAGLAVGFGAQHLIRDIITGFFILFENQYNVGDMIIIGDKEGVVEKMDLRTTQLRDLQGRLHIIPNGEIKTVTNLSKEWSRAVVDIEVAYSENLDKIFNILQDECQRFYQDPSCKSLILETPEVLGVETLGKDSITIRTIIKTKPLKQWEIARSFRRRLKERFNREGIGLSSPS